MPKYKFGDLVYNITEKVTPVAGDEELYIGLEHLDSGSLRVTRWGSKVALKGDKLKMREGDILFGRRNTYLRRVAIAPHDGLFSAHGMIFRAKTERIDPDYLPFFLASDCFMEEAIRISVGSLSPTVNWKELKELEFTIPDLETQHKNAQTLLAANDLKEKYEELLAVTDDLVKSQFIELFNGNQHPVKRLDEVSIVTSGLTKNSKRSAMQIKMKYLRVANVLFNELDLSDVQEIGVEEREIEKSLLQKNDLLFVEGNGSPDQIGRVSLWDGSIAPILHQNHLIKARFNGTVLPEYAMYYFMSDEGRKQILLSASTTSGLYTLSTGKIAAFELPIPPLTLQKKFLELTKQTDKSKFVAYQETIFIEKILKYTYNHNFRRKNNVH